MTQRSWAQRLLEATPCGAQTLSKRPEAFPYAHPVVADYGRGCILTDVNQRQYIDFIGGLGAVSLGYCNQTIHASVLKQMSRGVSFSFPHWLEAEVGELLQQVIPFEQVRFVKTGSEACTGAARIARMATGRETMLYVGYHGWHDGYASTREYHPGIPSGYGAVNIAVPYNDLSALETAFRHHGPVAGVMLEPTLVEAPITGYLENVLSMCRRLGTLCIFDEMLCGFRWATGGGTEYFALRPDLAVYGKGMANGYPLACIVGPKDLMRHAWPISGTFGGETLSLAACKAVVQTYMAEDVCGTLWALGRYFQDRFNRMTSLLGVGAECVGYPVHPVIRFWADELHWSASLFFQEWAKRGVLFHPQGGNIVYAMTYGLIEQALASAETALLMVREAQETGTVRDRLEGEPFGAHPAGRNVVW